MSDANKKEKKFKLFSKKKTEGKQTSDKKTTKKEELIEDKKKRIYDETCFSFSLRGGPIHTDLLVVSALFTIGKVSKFEKINVFFFLFFFFKQSIISKKKIKTKEE